MKTVSFKKSFVSQLVGALVLSAAVMGCAQDEQASVGGEADEQVAAQESGLSVGDFTNALTVGEAEAREWELRSATTTPATGSAQSYGQYDLYNGTLKQFVKYGERDTGINLVWSENAPGANAISIERVDGATGPLHYGEAVAIKFLANGYVKYGERDNGINLRWSNTPVYEWQIRRGPADSLFNPEPVEVPTGSTIQLFNITRGESVVYCHRHCGINLTWRNNCKNIPTPKLTRYYTNYLTDSPCW